jgi:transposase-like protein
VGGVASPLIANVYLHYVFDLWVEVWRVVAQEPVFCYTSPLVTLVISCPHCQGPDVVRNGKTPDGRQRFRCRDCQRRSTADARPQGYPEEQRELILRA